MPKTSRLKDPNDPYEDWESMQERSLMFGDVTWGERCKLRPLATIGSEPFSYDQTVKPFAWKPTAAGVVIGDDVEIMHHANIDRGIERDTTIGDGTKIDRHVHVAHDSIIGKNCILVAGTVVGGFVTMEDDVYCGINVSLKPRIRIGRGAKIGMGAVVLHDVPPGLIMVGNPAEPLKLRYPIEWYEEWCGPRHALRHDPWTHMPLVKWDGVKWSNEPAQALVGVIVNGRPVGVPFGEMLRYERIVELAGMTGTPSMTYRFRTEGDGRRSGTLCPHTGVIPEPGVVFNVSDTSNA